MKKLYCFLLFYPLVYFFGQVQVGEIVFDKMYFYQDTLYENHIKKFDLVLFSKNENIRFTRYEAPPYIRIDLPANYLQKEKKYIIPLYVSAERIKKLGHFQTLVKLYSNEAQDNEKILYVSGIVRPIPKKYTPQELAKLPQIQVKPLNNNIGQVKKGTIIPVSFVIENTGNAPLQILNVKTECSCTQWQMDTTAIPPKKSRTLTFKLDTQEVSVIHSEIWLWTNAANAPELKLLITGQIKP